MARSRSYDSFFDADFCPLDWFLKRRRLRIHRRPAGLILDLYKVYATDADEASEMALAMSLDESLVDLTRKRPLEMGSCSYVGVKSRKVRPDQSPSSSSGDEGGPMIANFSTILTLDGLGVVAGPVQHPVDR